MVPFRAQGSSEPMKGFKKRSPPEVVDLLGEGPIVARVFKVDSGFAMTFNKLQGATLDCLIAIMTDLNKMMMGDLSTAKANVAFTRVRTGKSFALFPCADHELDHLSKLHHPEWLSAWAGNYDDEGVWMDYRVPCSPAVLTAYGGMKANNPTNPTRGVLKRDLHTMTKGAGLLVTKRVACGTKKKGFEVKPLNRAELVTQLTREFPRFDQELERLAHSKVLVAMRSYVEPR